LALCKGQAIARSAASARNDGAPRARRNGTAQNPRATTAWRSKDGANAWRRDAMHSVSNDAEVVRAGAVLAFEELLSRLRQEVERALRYERVLSLVAIELGPGRTGSAEEIRAAATGAVRSVDIVGFDGAGELAIVFPETEDAAEIPARRVLEAVARLAPEARAGLARCPGDGVHAHTLIAAARAACRDGASRAVSAFWKQAMILRVGARDVVVADPGMQRLFATVRDIARSDLPVLVQGETGAGKEIVATALHAWSPRAGAGLVSINCAAVAESLLESELFGHERGAFTGAVGERIGLLEAAAGGTVFLDEIGDSSPRVQAGLLRAIETKAIRRLGAVAERPIDVRVVAASNRALDAEVAAERFRRDLFFRLGAAKIVVPPLRDRPLDIPVLARRFLEGACAAIGKPAPAISAEAVRQLQLYLWPGNVRELKNVMELLASVVHAAAIEAAHLPDGVRTTLPWQRPQPAGRAAADPIPPRFATLAEEIRDLERRRIAEALAASDGVRVRASERLGMPLRTLLSKIKAYGLDSAAGGRRR
jgi:DNA-binding NtrC family response regulator